MSQTPPLDIPADTNVYLSITGSNALRQLSWSSPNYNVFG